MGGGLLLAIALKFIEELLVIFASLHSKPHATAKPRGYESTYTSPRISSALWLYTNATVTPLNVSKVSQARFTRANVIGTIFNQS